MDEEELIDSDDAESSTPEFVSESVLLKEIERRRLQAEVEEFLARGGKIDQVPPNVVASPPKKPDSNYGGQPI